MVKQGLFIVESNQTIAKNVWKMTLSGDTSAITAPGQFVNIALTGMFLRRPISVCDCTDGGTSGLLTLIYKVVGRGTAALADTRPGEKLDLLTGLGNGYDLTVSGDYPLLLGGGVGVPPLYGLARALIAQGKRPAAILGFNTAEEVFGKEMFEALGMETFVATVDGSMGEKGFVTDVIPKAGTYSYFYTCGPEPMLKAVYHAACTSGQFSFEERMGCGFGACMGCSCKTKYGNKRICKDGPVLVKEEIIW